MTEDKKLPLRGKIYAGHTGEEYRDFPFRMKIKRREWSDSDVQVPGHLLLFLPVLME